MEPGLASSPRRVLAAVVAVSVLLPGLAVQAQPEEVLVAVLDSGIDLTHPDFTPSQVVAWWDFAAAGHPFPRPGETWDPRSEPDDLYGHGTAVASLAVGATKGKFPGAKLIVGRLDTVDENGDRMYVNADEAIRWAAGLGADVVVMSFGTLNPTPAVLEDVEDAVRFLHASGGLGVVAAGNGLRNSGFRLPSETESPSGSTFALVVGAEGASYSNLDPDVVAPGTVCAALAEGGTMSFQTGGQCSGRYGLVTGTSFAAPQAAGYAASAWHDARTAGRAPGVDDVRTAIQRTARDTTMPYTVEGYGVVDATTAARARDHLVAGTTPADDPVNGPAHEAVLRVRSAWSESLELGNGVYVPRGSSTPGLITTSTAAGRDADLRALVLEKGDRVEIELAYSGGLRDLELLVYSPGAAPMIRSGEDVLVSSEQGAGLSERVAFVAPQTGTYEISAEGWLVDGSVPYSLVIRVDGATAAATYLGDFTYVGARVLG